MSEPETGEKLYTQRELDDRLTEATKDARLLAIKVERYFTYSHHPGIDEIRNPSEAEIINLANTLLGGQK